jgi:hypothetical protein
MTRTFDRAVSVIRSEVPFGASNISDASRAVAVDGSRELIRKGEHREAVFWIAVTYARCMAVLDADAPPEIAAECKRGLDELRRELGVETFADLQRRADEVEAFLPELMRFARELVSANPEITDPGGTA